MKKQAVREETRKKGQTSPEETGPQDPVDKVVVEINNPQDPVDKGKTVRRTKVAISKTGVAVISRKVVTKVTVHKNLQLVGHKVSKVGNNQIVHKTRAAINAIIPTDKAADRDKTVTDQTEVVDKVEVNNKEKIKILAITAGRKNNLVLK